MNRLKLALMAAFTLAVGSIWAATPFAVWNGADSNLDFSHSTYVNSDKGVTYTLTVNSENATVADDSSYIEIGTENQKKTVTITAAATDGESTVTNPFGSSSSAGFTAIIKASKTATSLTSNRALICYYSSEKAGGAGIAQSQNGYAFPFCNNSAYSGDAYKSSSAVFTTEDTAQYIGVAYGTNPQGGMALSVDGKITYEAATMTSSGFATPEGVAIGGMPVDSSTFMYALQGMKIYAIALFDSRLSATEINTYRFATDINEITASISTDTDVTTLTNWKDDATLNLTVTADCTLTIPENTSVNGLNLTIDSGVTMTLASSGSIVAITSNGGTLKLTDGFTSPTISGSSALSIADNASVTFGASVTTTGGIAVGAGATLTAPYANVSAATGAFTGGTTAKVVMALALGTTNITGYQNLNSLWKFNNSGSWTGTVEISGNVGLFQLNQFGNASSTVAIGSAGLTSYIVTYTAGTSGAHNVGTLQLNGTWTIAGNYSSGKIVIPCTLTGTGTIQTSSASSSGNISDNNTMKGSSTVFLTGDISSFAGNIRVNAQTDNSGYSRFVILRTTNSTDDPSSDSNCPSYSDQTIAIAKGNSLTMNSSSVFTARKGFVVYGDLTANGKLYKWSTTVSSLVGGDGNVTTTTPSGKDWEPFTTTSGWTGTVTVPAFTLTSGTQCSIKFNSLGNANSTVVFNGNSESGQFWPVEYNGTINPTVWLNKNTTTYISNGTKSGKGTFSRLSGEGTLLIYGYNYVIGTLTNFTGAVGADAENKLSIGTIALPAGASPAIGDKLVSISTVKSNLDGVDSTVVTIGGETTAIKLEKQNAGQATGGLYVKGVASDGTSQYVTVGAAVDAVGSEGGTIAVSESTENETLTIAGDVTLTLADGVTLDVSSLSGAGALTVNAADSGTATIKVPKGATLGNLTIGDGVTLYVEGEIASGDALFTLTGENATDFATVATDYGVIHLTNANGVFSAGRTYHWIGTASEDNNTLFTNSAKWSYEDAGSAITDSTYPIMFDTAIFNVKGSGTSFVTSKQAYTSYCHMVVKQDFTFYNKVQASHYIGTAATSTAINPTFTIEDGATATLISSGKDKLFLTSKLEGAGNLVGIAQGTGTSAQYSCITIEGDTSAFTGTVDLSLGRSDQYNRIGGTSSLNNSLSKWFISTNGVVTSGTGGRTPFALDSKTYKFGVLKAWVGSCNKNEGIAVDTGYIDEDSWLRGTWYSSLNNNSVKWEAATATLSLGITNTTSLTVANTGKVYIYDDKSTPGTITFTASGTLVLDENNASAAGAIIGAITAPSVALGFEVSSDASADLSTAETFNLASDVSFNKSGAGKLTITGAFTSIGTVDVTGDGALVLVATDDGLEAALAYVCASGTKCEISNDFKTYTFSKSIVDIDNGSGDSAGYMQGTEAVITNATGTITIPATATAIKSVLVNTNVVYTYTGTAITDANKSTTVLVYATDANGAIDTTTQIGAWCTVAVADGKVTIALDQSKVTPNLVTDDATYPPMDIGSTAITFAVPFKVGLWYAVKSGTSIGANGVLGGTTATTTPVKATSTATTPLSVDLSNASVEFYRIAVGASKAALTTND